MTETPPRATPATDAACWTIAETAAVYRVTERTVRNWIARGELQAVREGRRVQVVPPARVEAACR